MGCLKFAHFREYTLRKICNYIIHRSRPRLHQIKMIAFRMEEISAKICAHNAEQSWIKKVILWFTLIESIWVWQFFAICGEITYNTFKNEKPDVTCKYVAFMLLKIHDDQELNLKITVTSITATDNYKEAIAIKPYPNSKWNCHR